MMNNSIKLIGLFSNQEEANEATERLHEAVLGDPDVYVLGAWSKNLERLLIRPISNPSSVVSGAIGPRGTVMPSTTHSGNEADRFFKQAVQKGGFVVVVDFTGDEYLDRAESILHAEKAAAVAATAS